MSAASTPRERAASGATGRPWWKESVVYQIYPRSFCDSNGDGIGDLPGITSRLEHLAALGVDAVWLSPVYRSPNDDNGYDISDYREIAPEFGTMADFDEMLAAMHARGIRLVMDLVVNHTSDEHPWFEQARRSRTDPLHDYYIWADPAPGGGPPTNWESFFSGSAWAYNEPTGEYYLHMFSVRQPELNWENPALRAQVHALMRFWLDKGVDGFRMDVINLISKRWTADGRLPDAPAVRPGFLQPAGALVCDGPRLLEFLGEMRGEVLDHYDGVLSIGEAPSATPEQGLALTDERSGPLDMVFQFEHVDLDTIPGDPRGKWAWQPLDVRAWKTSMFRWQRALDGRGWNSLYLSNHDQPRPVSRYGDDRRWRVESAKMLGTLLHGLQGTPYVYQGEELGMTNMPFGSVDELRDVESLNWYRAALAAGVDEADVMAAIRLKGRDNTRTPMQWDASPQAGFTTGVPWLAVNPNHRDINATAARADPDSVFHHYRRLIALRRTHPVIAHGRCEPLQADHPRLCAWLRRLDDATLLVVGNFSAEPLAFDLRADVGCTSAELLISNHPARPEDADPRHGVLRPYEARWHLLSGAG